MVKQTSKTYKKPKKKKTYRQKTLKESMPKRPRGRPKKQRFHISLERAKKIHNSKSSKARKLDEMRTSKYKVTDSRYLDNPKKYDYPGVDTKDVGYKRKRAENSKRMIWDTETLKSKKAQLKKAKSEKQKTKLRADIAKVRKRLIKGQRRSVKWSQKV